MFNLGIQELIIIFIIALLFIGPKQLPELAKTLGKIVRDFRRATNEITDSVQREARKIDDFKEEVAQDIKKDVDFKLISETDSVATNTPSKEETAETKPEDPTDDRNS
jgi:Tat protein translocase TatB subunit